ncbi:MAG: ABC transporter permease [Rubrivivax sp.]
MSTEALSPWREAWRVFASNKAALLGLALLAAVVMMMLAGPGLYGVAAFDIAGAPFTPPFTDRNLWLGTDYLGRDVLAGVLIGGRATVMVGLAAAAVAVSIGVTVGALAGYFGGWVDLTLSRVTELFQVLPALLFAMVLVTLFQPSLTVVVFAIGVVAWTGTARLARAEFLRLSHLEYANAARAMGAGHGRLMLREILPNALPPLIVSATLIVGAAILFEAGLSFLGLSDPNVMSWGLMIGSNRRNILECWWAVTFPGAAIFVTVLAVSLIGDGLNDAFNPKLHLR